MMLFGISHRLESYMLTRLQDVDVTHRIRSPADITDGFRGIGRGFDFETGVASHLTFQAPLTSGSNQTF